MRQLRPDIPVELEAAVMRCLEKDKTRRTQTIAELARALAPFAQDHSHISVERIHRVLSDATPMPVRRFSIPDIPPPAEDDAIELKTAALEFVGDADGGPDGPATVPFNHDSGHPASPGRVPVGVAVGPKGAAIPRPPAPPPAAGWAPPAPPAPAVAPFAAPAGPAAVLPAPVVMASSAPAYPAPLSPEQQIKSGSMPAIANDRSAPSMRPPGQPRMRGLVAGVVGFAALAVVGVTWFAIKGAPASPAPAALQAAPDTMAPRSAPPLPTATQASPEPAPAEAAKPAGPAETAAAAPTASASAEASASASATAAKPVVPKGIKPAGPAKKNAKDALDKWK
jgi:hypothetical protein